jgi:hypothetical protein
MLFGYVFNELKPGRFVGDVEISFHACGRREGDIGGDGDGSLLAEFVDYPGTYAAPPAGNNRDLSSEPAQKCSP